ncbi:hypothetical protein V1478_015390 [Vespula squamosa]|uniref:Uncharacterized protein n=1 Tax=Vespula squamosa TaxID=30214 RepID=A0ABD2A5C1_VESSQ
MLLRSLAQQALRMLYSPNSLACRRNRSQPARNPDRLGSPAPKESPKTEKGIFD